MTKQDDAFMWQSLQTNLDNEQVSKKYEMMIVMVLVHGDSNFLFSSLKAIGRKKRLEISGLQANQSKYCEQNVCRPDRHKKKNLVKQFFKLNLLNLILANI